MKKVMSSELMSTKALNLLLKVRNLESDNLLAYVHNLYKKDESKTKNWRLSECEGYRVQSHTQCEDETFVWSETFQGDDDGRESRTYGERTF